MAHSNFCEQLQFNKPFTHEHHDNNVIVRIDEVPSDEEINELWKFFPNKENGKLIILTPKYEIHKK